ncbi:hypothetical protein HPB47_001922, partial [Ixodes persulcatus]
AGVLRTPSPGVGPQQEFPFSPPLPPEVPEEAIEPPPAVEVLEELAPLEPMQPEPPDERMLFVQREGEPRPQMREYLQAVKCVEEYVGENLVRGKLILESKPAREERLGPDGWPIRGMDGWDRQPMMGGSGGRSMDDGGLGRGRYGGKDYRRPSQGMDRREYGTGPMGPDMRERDKQRFWKDPDELYYGELRRGPAETRIPIRRTSETHSRAELIIEKIRQDIEAFEKDAPIQGYDEPVRPQSGGGRIGKSREDFDIDDWRERRWSPRDVEEEDPEGRFRKTGRSMSSNDAFIDARTRDRKLADADCVFRYESKPLLVVKPDTYRKEEAEGAAGTEQEGGQPRRESADRGLNVPGGLDDLNDLQEFLLEARTRAKNGPQYMEDEFLPRREAAGSRSPYGEFAVQSNKGVGGVIRPMERRFAAPIPPIQAQKERDRLLKFMIQQDRRQQQAPAQENNKEENKEKSPAKPEVKDANIETTKEQAAERVLSEANIQVTESRRSKGTTARVKTCVAASATHEAGATRNVELQAEMDEEEQKMWLANFSKDPAYAGLYAGGGFMPPGYPPPGSGYQLHQAYQAQALQLQQPSIPVPSSYSVHTSRSHEHHHHHPSTKQGFKIAYLLPKNSERERSKTKPGDDLFEDQEPLGAAVGVQCQSLYERLLNWLYPDTKPTEDRSLMTDSEQLLENSREPPASKNTKETGKKERTKGKGEKESIEAKGPVESEEDEEQSEGKDQDKVEEKAEGRAEKEDDEKDKEKGTKKEKKGKKEDDNSEEPSALVDGTASIARVFSPGGPTAAPRRGTHSPQMNDDGMQDRSAIGRTRRRTETFRFSATDANYAPPDRRA